MRGKEADEKKDAHIEIYLKNGYGEGTAAY